MKSLVQIKALLGAMALAALMPMTLDAQRPTFIGNPNLVRGDDPELNDCTDADVARIARDAEAGLEWQERAAQMGMKVQGNCLLLNISCNRDADSRENLRNVVAIYAAEVLPGGSASSLCAFVDPMLLDDLEVELRDSGNSPRISAYRTPVANAYGDIATEGEGAMRSELYGLDGKGAVIAVMDIGFAGLFDEGGEVSRRYNESLDSDGRSHGTAMIEVIRDIAPAAVVLAYRIDENLDIRTATLDAVSCGADVIVSALSFFDLPGCSAADEAANIAASNKVRWVNAAGNFGDGRYFEAQTPELVDLSGEQFVAFGSDDPYQYIEEAAEIRVHLAQESDADTYDDAQLALELYSWDGMSANLVLEAIGNHLQRVQTIVHAAEPGKYYFPMVRLARDGALKRMRMFSESAALFFNTRHGSIACPGGTGGVLTVGAVNAGNYVSGGTVENYSGRGGGVFDLNLDLCGPSHCTTGIYGPQGFTGTSAAAAHVASLIALHMTDSGLAQDPVGLIRTLDIMGLGQDTDSGAGLALAQVDDAEPDNDIDQATDLISAGQYVDGRSLSPSNDRDWFSFEIIEAMSADVVSSADGVSMFMVGETDGNDGFGPVVKLDGLSHAVLHPGKYYILVRGGFLTSYNLSLDLYQDAPTPVTQMSPANGQELPSSDPDAEQYVELAWGQSEGLGPIAYRVQVLDGKDTRMVIFDGVVRETSLSVPGLQINKPYVWRVCAINPHGAAEFSNYYSFMFVEATEANAGSDTSEELLAPHATEDASVNEASGCAGSTGSNGMIALLIALVAAAALKQRKLVRTKA